MRLRFPQWQAGVTTALCGRQVLRTVRRMVVTHVPLEGTAGGIIYLSIFQSPRHIRYLKRSIRPCPGWPNDSLDSLSPLTDNVKEGLSLPYTSKKKAAPPGSGATSPRQLGPSPRVGGFFFPIRSMMLTSNGAYIKSLTGICFFRTKITHCDGHFRPLR